MAIQNAVGVALSFSAAPTHSYSLSVPNTRLVGSNGPDSLTATGANETLVGGSGDDTYTVWFASDVIIEAPNAGIDTVMSYAKSFVLPANVENLFVLADGASGTGNSGDNIIIGGAGSQTLDGGGGNDVLVGGGGNDVFVMSKGVGSDLIYDFVSGSDVVQLNGFDLYNFAMVRSAMSQSGTSTLLNLGNGQTMVFLNKAVSSFTSADFQLKYNPVHAGMKLTFADEFNSFSASAHGTGTLWKTTLGITTDYRTLSQTNDAEYFSDSSVGTNPFSISNGVLNITASPGSNPLHHTYNSGAITTAATFAQEYGYFEMRAQLPSGQGFWPAFWLLPINNSWPPEIDIMEELGKDPTTDQIGLHSSVGSGFSKAISGLPDLSTGFHTYGLSWQADTIKWYIDGNEVAEAPTPADMHQPMYMLVDLAVGTNGSWAGSTAASLPTAHMLIDYVHAYQYAPVIVKAVADVGLVGGIYTAPVNGLDSFDFSLSQAPIQMDAAGLSTTIGHVVFGSAGNDTVHAGAGLMQFNGGAGDDLFYFGAGGARVTGGSGNDTFVLTKGQIAQGDLITDFHHYVSASAEHDTLHLVGFSAAAHVVFASAAGTGGGYCQFYQIVDGSYVSPTITLGGMVPTTRLDAHDYAFTAS